MTNSALFWNVWGHRNASDVNATLENLLDVDVICLTEVTDADALDIVSNGTNLVYGSRDEAPTQVDGYNQVGEVLCDTHGISYASATRRNWRCEDTKVKFSSVGFGAVIALRNDCKLISRGESKYKTSDKDIKDRVLQWVVYEKQGIRYLVAHMHGVWIKDNTKGDHIVRDEQSRFVRNLLSMCAKKYSVRKIVFGGDFNLDIDTQALRILEEGEDETDFKLINLIKEYSVINTRTSAYREYGKVGRSMYADYVLVSEDIGIDAFVVDSKNNASDHAPLIVHFN